MSLQGDLKHFPLIDVIQLLHGARKSGVLRLSSDIGESQLVFHEGDLVSANYLNNRVRIGQVLVSAGAISDQQLARALEIQNSAGAQRKPLVITMLEQGMVNEATAYNCLESLIEMTIVEVLTWKGGNFTLEIDGPLPANGHQFSPDDFHQRILLNTQGVLMESLRILDEKTRDGTMDEILSIAGLSDLDLITENGSGATYSHQATREYDSPPLRQALAEQRNMARQSEDRSYRAPETLEKLINAEYPAIKAEQRQQLIALLTREPAGGGDTEHKASQAVIIYSRSPLLTAMIRSLCHQQGISAIEADNGASLVINLRLLLCQMLRPLVLLDIPHDGDPQDALRICEDLDAFPQVSLVLLACARYWNNSALRALGSGIRTIIPRPCGECPENEGPRLALSFCAELGNVLGILTAEPSGGDQRFFTCISALREGKTGSEIINAILAYLRGQFERAVVLLVTERELIVDQVFGVTGPPSGEPVTISGLRIPHDDQEIFEKLLQNGRIYYGFHSDSTWPHQLYRAIGRPDSPEVLLFPLVRVKTVIAFIYADFGTRYAPPPSLRHLEALDHFANSRVSVLAYRQKLKSLLDSAGKPAPE